MNIRVTIEGRDVAPCARLLEALTKSGLLEGRCIWEEYQDKIILHIKGSEQDAMNFQEKRFQTETHV